MYKSVFISYARTDQVFALKFANDLENEGVNVWIDKHDLKAGDTWPRQIRQAIIDQDACIIILSENYSPEREWLKKEADQADIDDKAIVPIRIDENEIPDFIKSYQYADFANYDQDEQIYQRGILEILETIRKPTQHTWNNPIDPYMNLIKKVLESISIQGVIDENKVEGIKEYQNKLLLAKDELRKHKGNAYPDDEIQREKVFIKTEELDEIIEQKETELEECKRISNIKTLPINDLYHQIIRSFIENSEAISFGFIAIYDKGWKVVKDTSIGINEELVRHVLKRIQWENLRAEVSYPISSIKSELGVTKITYKKNKKAIIGFGGNDVTYFVSREFNRIINFLFKNIEYVMQESYDSDIFDTRNTIVIEGNILDQLRTTHKDYMDDYKDLRLELFKKRLKSVQIFFQPIIDVHQEGTTPYIDSFEALARCTIGGKPNLPKDIFITADLWGKDFKYSLDTKLLLDAISLYYQLRKKTRGINRTEDERPLAINVHPQTLIDPRFFDLVKKATSYPRQIQAKNLVLEISEKEGEEDILINQLGADEKQNNERPNIIFRNILKKFVHKLGIHFAIDDFGKANANIPRLDALQPSVVKLDRTILLHGKNELKSTVQKIRTREYPYPVKIVAEGYDKEVQQKLKLSDIQKSGVEYVQGYGLSGLPKQRLKRLTEKQRENIKEQYAHKKS